jgi:hypothetical protein
LEDDVVDHRWLDDDLHGLDLAAKCSRHDRGGANAAESGVEVGILLVADEGGAEADEFR